MSQQALTVFFLLAAVCGQPTAGAALADDPLVRAANAKELAKARATLGNVNDLAQAKLADSRHSADNRFKEFLAGRGTLEWVVDSHYRVLESELAVAANDSERVAAVERLWVVFHTVEEVNEARSLAGRIPISDYMFSVLSCRDAEIRLAKAREKAARMLTLVGAGVKQYEDWLHPLDARELAKQKFAGANAPMEVLLRAKRKAADIEFLHRFEEFRAARGTLDFVLRSVMTFLDAERAVTGDTPAAQAAYYEAYWVYTREMERINKGRHAAGRIPIQDYMFSRYFLLDAHIGLLRTAAKEASAVHRALGVLGVHDELAPDEPDYFKEVAKDRRAALSADVNRLLHERREAARIEYDARAKEFLAGRGAQAFLHDVVRHLRDAELAIAKQDAERREIQEGHWARCKSIEGVNKGRFEQGRIPTKDYLESRWYRLDAEIALVRVLEKK